MSAFAEKLKAAGADTIGAQLTTACIDAIRVHPNNVEAAWRHVGVVFGHDLIKSLMGDMNPVPPIPARSLPQSPQNFVPAIGIAPAYKPRVIPADRLEKRRELREIVRSKYKTSAGIAWSDITWHSLSAMSRDGNEAKALLSAGPANVPNDGRTVGDVIGVNQVNDIIGKMRS